MNPAILGLLGCPHPPPVANPSGLSLEEFSVAVRSGVGIQLTFPQDIAASIEIAGLPETKAAWTEIAVLVPILCLGLSPTFSANDSPLTISYARKAGLDAVILGTGRLATERVDIRCRVGGATVVPR